MEISDYILRDSPTGTVNVQMVTHTLGVLLLFEAVLLLICVGVSMIYGEGDLLSFTLPMAVCIILGGASTRFGRKKQQYLGRREAYIVVALSWILFTLFGMLPFLIGGYISSVTDAFFETMSGFTTTGATILNDIESLPHGILFWRSLTQWIGGLGIVFFTIILLPGFGSSSQMLFLSEATGVTHDKIHPKTKVMARYIWMIYIALTAVEIPLLMIGGMNLFDAICHALCTTATGGFSTKQDSVAYWNSPFIEYTISLFMIISSINFSLYFLALKGNAKALIRNKELRWFLRSVGILTLVITFALVFCDKYGIEEAFRKALFQVATCHTSCGFATDDYTAWPPFTWTLLIFAMLSGGCTGSTSGGIKNMRLMIMTENIRNQFKQILHPNAVLPIRMGKGIDNKLNTTVLIFFVSYMLVTFIGWTLLMACGIELTESISLVISAMGNVGPALGNFGPAFSLAALPDVAKWILSALMIIGRLEIFGFLLAFYTPTWKGNWT